MRAFLYLALAVVAVAFLSYRLSGPASVPGSLSSGIEQLKPRAVMPEYYRQPAGQVPNSTVTVSGSFVMPHKICSGVACTCTNGTSAWVC